MVINFIGNFTTPNMVGEVSDETHLARELERAGHTVRKLQRDEWRAYVRKEPNNIPQDIKADINIVAKWMYFYDGSFIKQLREESQAPVFYWVWDFMGPDFPEWHIKMAQEADLYLSGEGGLSYLYQKLGVNFHYFQMDCCDGDLPVYPDEKKIYDVVFTGSHYTQGHRLEWLKEINKVVKVIIFGFGHENWIKEGFEAYPPVFGSDYNKVIAQSKIVLGFGYTIPCWGYWSNRVGKVLRAGGFLLHEFIPGMETQLPTDIVKYFNSPEEAIEKILYYLSDNKHIQKRSEIVQKHSHKFTSKQKIRQLLVLMENYLKALQQNSGQGDSIKWNQI